MVNVWKEAIEELRLAVRGEVLLPTDAKFEEARKLRAFHKA